MEIAQTTSLNTAIFCFLCAYLESVLGISTYISTCSFVTEDLYCSDRPIRCLSRQGSQSNLSWFLQLNTHKFLLDDAKCIYYVRYILVNWQLFCEILALYMHFKLWPYCSVCMNVQDNIISGQIFSACLVSYHSCSFVWSWSKCLLWNAGIDYLSVAAYDDLCPSHLVLLEGRVRNLCLMNHEWFFLLILTGFNRISSSWSIVSIQS